MENMEKKTILIQGALDIELEYILNSLNNKRYVNISEYEFCEGTIDNIRIVVSKTLVGTINATTATCIGIINFNPNIVINQGIAGSHTETLHIGNIVIGEKCCNINSYNMPLKNKGEGSNPFEWELNKRAKDIQYANLQLVDILEKSLISNNKKHVYRGILGSGDLFSREYDRIVWINNIFNNLCEDMESIGVYSVCNKFNIPCVGIRIISNNELLQEKLDKKQAIELQKILISVLKDISSI